MHVIIEACSVHDVWPMIPLYVLSKDITQIKTYPKTDYIRGLGKPGVNVSPGLVVMGGDSCSKGLGVQIPAQYTGWTFFHIYLL